MGGLAGELLLLHEEQKIRREIGLEAERRRQEHGHRQDRRDDVVARRETDGGKGGVRGEAEGSRGRGESDSCRSGRGRGWRDAGGHARYERYGRNGRCSGRGARRRGPEDRGDRLKCQETEDSSPATGEFPRVPALFPRRRKK